MDAKTFADRVKKARDAQDLTQRQLSTMADVRPMTISEWERGKRKTPGKDEVERVAAVLGVDPGWLLYGDVGEDTALEAPGWREWAGSGESASATDEERSVLVQWGRAAAAEGFGLRPAAYSAALVILRTYGRPATTR